MNRVRGDKPFLMRDDVDSKFTLLVLDQVDVGVDTFSLVSPRQFGCDEMKDEDLRTTKHKKGDAYR